MAGAAVLPLRTAALTGRQRALRPAHRRVGA